MKKDAIPATGLTRDEQLKLIWRYTHKDYRSITNGKRMVLIFRTGVGTCLVPLDSLTADEIANKLPYALRKEREKQLRREAKVWDAIRAMGINPL